MSTLSRFWKKVSRIGTQGVFDARHRFEIITINQISVLAFFFSLFGQGPQLMQYNWGPSHNVASLYTLLFLLPLFWNSIRWYVTAKVSPLISVSLYSFIVGLAFGLDSQAHTIFLILIPFTILFFYRKPFWFQAALVIPQLAFPVALLVLHYQGKLPLIDPGIPFPPQFGFSNYVLTAIISIILFNLIIQNFRKLLLDINKKRMRLLNENARNKVKVQGVEETVYGTVHDLKSPLTSAIGLTEIIESEPDNEERARSFKFLKQSLNRLKNQVEMLLQERGLFNQESDFEQVDLKEEIQEILSMISNYPGYDRIRIEVDIDQPVPLVTDPGCLKVVLSNLLSNAVKYMDDSKSKPHIRIVARIRADECYIRIQDNGIGISEKDLPKVFNKSFRATEKAEGSGLGLALVKKALDLVDGKISIESELGKGTTVTVSHLTPIMESRSKTEKEASLN